MKKRYTAVDIITFFAPAPGFKKSGRLFMGRLGNTVNTDIQPFGLSVLDNSDFL